MTAREFDDAVALDAYLQGLNERGRDAEVAVLDANGIPWLTYGEERTWGGEGMACWFADVAPWDRAAEGRCDECDMPRDQVPLTSATYPVILLHDPERDS